MPAIAKGGLAARLKHALTQWDVVNDWDEGGARADVPSSLFKRDAMRRAKVIPQCGLTCVVCSYLVARRAALLHEPRAPLSWLSLRRCNHLRFFQQVNVRLASARVDCQSLQCTVVPYLLTAGPIDRHMQQQTASAGQKTETGQSKYVTHSSMADVTPDALTWSTALKQRPRAFTVQLTHPCSCQAPILPVRLPSRRFPTRTNPCQAWLQECCKQSSANLLAWGEASMRLDVLRGIPSIAG